MINYRGVTSSQYSLIHQWLKKTYGKASKCVNKTCEQKNKHYEWALKHGCKYDYKVTNFLQLCRSCHRKMDSTEEGRKKQSKRFKGKKLSPERVEKIKLRLIGRKVSKETRKKLREVQMIPVEQLKDGRVIARFPSGKEAGESVNRSQSAISLCANGKSKSCAGFQWRYMRKKK